LTITKKERRERQSKDVRNIHSNSIEWNFFLCVFFNRKDKTINRYQ
jgi:hypothetical protein